MTNKRKEKLLKGCGKQVPAGFDKEQGYSLYNTCGFILMGDTYLCPNCKKDLKEEI